MSGEFKKAKGNGSSGGLIQLMRNGTPKGRQQDRCFFLPPALDVPALVLDLQDLRTETLASVKRLDRVASIDSPFAETLVAQVSRYYGRVGAPSLDVDQLARDLLG